MGGALAMFTALGPYVWFIVGAVLLTAEVILPGLNLIWFGAAATGGGAILLWTPLEWTIQIALFIGFSGASVIAARFIAARRDGAAADTVNRGADTMVGREVVLAEPITAGHGRAHVADTLWRGTGPDAPAGARVKVTGIDAATLVVEPVKTIE